VLEETRMEIKIEKDVPIPEGGLTGLGKVLSSMEIGDSILIPASKRTYMTYYQGRSQPKKFVTCSCEDGNVRVWRTA